MTRKNKKAHFRLSPIACALALSFAFGAVPAVHAYAASDLRGNFKRAVDFDSKNRLRAGAKVGLQNKEGFTLNARLDYERESSSSAILAGGIEALWRF